eukprot:gb/GECH01011082.1/.p1 GENE.gb/GECH01011082.1/~~gb/GECH01011082.1/.p1  ORF type:complete len:895 (+),score=151.57 gb/GECH01011082.1/:1-2685(+)
MKIIRVMVKCACPHLTKVSYSTLMWSVLVLSLVLVPGGSAVLQQFESIAETVIDTASRMHLPPSPQHVVQGRHTRHGDITGTGVATETVLFLRFNLSTIPNHARVTAASFSTGIRTTGTQNVIRIMDDHHHPWSRRHLVPLHRMPRGGQIASSRYTPPSSCHGSFFTASLSSPAIVLQPIVSRRHGSRSVTLRVETASPGTALFPHPRSAVPHHLRPRLQVEYTFPPSTPTPSLSLKCPPYARPATNIICWLAPVLEAHVEVDVHVPVPWSLMGMDGRPCYPRTPESRDLWDGEDKEPNDEGGVHGCPADEGLSDQDRHRIHEQGHRKIQLHLPPWTRAAEYRIQVTALSHASPESTAAAVVAVDPPPRKCHHHRECQGCVQDGWCGWCPASQTCLPITRYPEDDACPNLYIGSCLVCPDIPHWPSLGSVASSSWIQRERLRPRVTMIGGKDPIRNGNGTGNTISGEYTGPRNPSEPFLYIYITAPYLRDQSALFIDFLPFSFGVDGYQPTFCENHPSEGFINSPAATFSDLWITAPNALQSRALSGIFPAYATSPLWSVSALNCSTVQYTAALSPCSLASCHQRGHPHPPSVTWHPVPDTSLYIVSATLYTSLVAPKNPDAGPREGFLSRVHAFPFSFLFRVEATVRYVSRGIKAQILTVGTVSGEDRLSDPFRRQMIVRTLSARHLTRPQVLSMPSYTMKRRAPDVDKDAEGTEWVVTCDTSAPVDMVHQTLHLKWQLCAVGEDDPDQCSVSQDVAWVTVEIDLSGPVYIDGYGQAATERTEASSMSQSSLLSPSSIDGGWSTPKIRIRSGNANQETSNTEIIPSFRRNDDVIVEVWPAEGEEAEEKDMRIETVWLCTPPFADNTPSLSDASGRGGCLNVGESDRVPVIGMF